mgnify:CR=1 FL=1
MGQLDLEDVWISDGFRLRKKITGNKKYRNLQDLIYQKPPDGIYKTGSEKKESP